MSFFILTNCLAKELMVPAVGVSSSSTASAPASALRSCIMLLDTAGGLLPAFYLLSSADVAGLGLEVFYGYSKLTVFVMESSGFFLRLYLNSWNDYYFYIDSNPLASSLELVQPMSRKFSNKILVAISLLSMFEVFSMTSWQSNLKFFIAARSV